VTQQTGGGRHAPVRRARLRTALTALAVAAIASSLLIGASATMSPSWSAPPSGVALLSQTSDIGAAPSERTPTPPSTPAQARGPGRGGGRGGSGGLGGPAGLFGTLIEVALALVGFLLSLGLMFLFGRRRGHDGRHARRPDTANAAHGGLTPSDVRNVAFNKPPLGGAGYNQDEVDALLDRVHAKLLDPSHSSFTAADIHNFAFSQPPSGKRGYNQDEVDAFLDLVQAEIRRLDGPT
jgi:DivIVA domain-containing protein